MANNDLISKAKRRIKRFIATGMKEHRVTSSSKNVFNYRVKAGEYLHFRADKRGYLRQFVS